MQAAAADRADAFRSVLAQNASPDWPQMTRQLTRSYTALKTTLARAADARPGL
jgi:hypothetical protein